MIVFRNEFQRIVDVLPAFIDANNVSFNIKFDGGTTEYLNKYLSLFTENTPYPLIWLVDGKDNHNEREPSVQRKARIIIATRSLNVDELNPFQYENDFGKILYPIANNLLLALKLGGISRYDDTNIDTEEFVNYTNADLTNQIDVWNALALEIDITFSGVNNCLKTINFNN